MTTKVDVAIIGGGPAGATVGTLLKKYNPALTVSIFEREKFPRDHVGESLLPVVSKILNEMGIWEEIEAANFPIKVGATYKWGRADELWDIEFVPSGELNAQPRPAKYAGQRLKTAFQVDRSIYDQILLNHAKAMGCDVREETAVRVIDSAGDRVTGLTLEDGSRVEARYYVDCSGHSGILRRAMKVQVNAPTKLQNIAIWDYWRNATWAVSIGVGGTRIQIMSVPYGWIWFIPLGPDRTSIGLVLPADYYKKTGKRPEEIYREAIESEPRISKLLENATSEGRLASTKDWSFLSERLAGENWFLAGESAGFADPILSAGLSLTHVGGRDVAYTILELEKGEFEPEWLRSRYDASHRAQINQHIRFADYWYTQNGIFSELKDYVREIAGDAGLDMSPEEAWRWFGQGGFIDHFGGTGVGGFGIGGAKQISSAFTGQDPHHEIVGKSHFKIDLEGAVSSWSAVLDGGKITRYPNFERDGKVVNGAGFMGWFVNFLKVERSYKELTRGAQGYLISVGIPVERIPAYSREFFDILEALVSDGWVMARTEEGAETIPPFSLNISGFVHPNRDAALT